MKPEQHEIEEAQSNIPVELVDMVMESPRLFPSVVKSIGGTSIEGMRAARDELALEIARRRMYEHLGQYATYRPEDSPFVR